MSIYRIKVYEVKDLPQCLWGQTTEATVDIQKLFNYSK